jgi:predicted HTH transcriptional regulator
MRVFKDLDLVEQLGSGMSRILKAYDRSVFKISDYFIQVEFPIANINEGRNEGRNNREDKILQLLRDSPSMTKDSIARALGVSLTTIERDFGNLKKKDLIEREGSTKNGLWTIKEHSAAHK